MPLHPALVLPFFALPDATQTAAQQGSALLFVGAEAKVAL